MLDSGIYGAFLERSLNPDPVTQLAFSLHGNPGVYAVLLGSGMSRSAAIPTGWEITLDLVRQVALSQGEPEQSDWAAWYRANHGGEPNYSTLLERLAAAPAERRAILDGYIEPTAQEREQGMKLPTDAHRAIARLVRDGFIKLIVTTNFDRLMENALRDEGVEPTVVASVDALAGAVPLAHSQCFVLKLHGDYKDARSLNTEEELAVYPEEYGRLLDRIFDEYGLIVCGWSGEWDHALRAAILRSPNRRYSMFWAARDGVVMPRADDLVKHRHGVVIPISDADSFFSAVQNRVDLLAKSNEQDPRSVELAVSAAKRFLAKPEHRIQLEEHFADTTRIVLDALDKFPAPAAWGIDAFREMTTKQLACLEALCRMCGVLGRWGNEANEHIGLEVVQRLFQQAQAVQAGFGPYLNQRSFPAVLAFTAYGLGLTRAGRWTALHRLLTARVDTSRSDEKRLVDELFLFAWAGGTDDTWRHFEGSERWKTPLSRILAQIFERWGAAFLGTAPGFDQVYDRFETLASLAYFERFSDYEIAAVNSGRWVRMPGGKALLSERRAEAELAAIEAPPLRQALLAAGFLQGNEGLFAPFRKNYLELARMISWQ